METKLIESEKECNIDIYSNGASVTLNDFECLLTFHRETPSLNNDGIVNRENIARVRMNPEIAKRLALSMLEVFKQREDDTNE